jgi:hypothetical protein
VALGAVGTVFAFKTVDAVNAPIPGTVIAGVNSVLPASVGSINFNAIRSQEHQVLMNGVITTVLFSAAIGAIVSSTLLLLSD